MDNLDNILRAENIAIFGADVVAQLETDEIVRCELVAEKVAEAAYEEAYAEAYAEALLS